MGYIIQFYHDTRKANKQGLFPVKLRVYDDIRKRAKLYDIKRYYSVEDFNNINFNRPSKKFLDARRELDEIKSKAETIAKNLSIFNFEDFERDFNSNNIDKSNIIEYYNRKIKELAEQDRIKSKSGYETSLKSIKKFINPNNPDAVKELHILDITPKWLQKYEKYMIDKGRSISTVGIYLRDLRAIYNMMLEDKPSYKEHYPFSKYTIPSSENKKKALSHEEMRTLYTAIPKTIQQVKARDFFIFSYVCNGMNINDIARLTFENYSEKEKKITFYRGKTQGTTKANMKNIEVYLNDIGINILNKYANTNATGKDYIFPILANGMTEAEKIKKIEAFTRFVNQHISKLAESLGLPKISSYWARHSYSNIALNSGASIEYISEALGHTNIRTTQNYIKGFDDGTKQEITAKITEFLE